MATHTLLAADDSQTVRRIIEMACAGADLDVVTVGDGDAAIARISERPPDIVLADIAMPSRDGYAVASFVKGRPELAHIPVLLLAGMFDPANDARARDAGCDEVLVKPLKPQVLRERVAHWLRGPMVVDSETSPAVFVATAAEVKAEGDPDVDEAVVTDAGVDRDLTIADAATTADAMTVETAARVETTTRVDPVTPVDPAVQAEPAAEAVAVGAVVAGTEASVAAEVSEMTGRLMTEVDATAVHALLAGSAPVSEQTPDATDVPVALGGSAFGSVLQQDAGTAATTPDAAALDSETALHGGGAPAPVSAATEDYFSRLDAAFQALNRPIGARLGETASVSAADASAGAASVPTLQELIGRLPEDTRHKLTAIAASLPVAPSSPAVDPALDAIVDRLLERLMERGDLLEQLARRLDRARPRDDRA